MPHAIYIPNEGTFLTRATWSNRRALLRLHQQRARAGAEAWALSNWTAGGTYSAVAVGDFWALRRVAGGVTRYLGAVGTDAGAWQTSLVQSMLSAQQEEVTHMAEILAGMTEKSKAVIISIGTP